MSKNWKPRPPSFPSDENIRFPFTAAEINEFEDTADLEIHGRYDRSPSDGSINSMKKSKLMRARDSVFVRQKQRNSIVSNNHFNISDNESVTGSQSSRNVHFEGYAVNYGFDSDVFAANEEDVVLRRKTNSSANTFGESDGFEFDSDDNANETKSEVESKPWDIFKTLPPPDEDETLDGVWVEFFIKCLKIVAYLFTFIIIIISAVLSKSLIMLMSSMTRIEGTIEICNDNQIYSVEPKLDPDKHYKVLYKEDDPQRIAWIWCLFFAVIAPDVFAFGRSFRICYFKIFKVPRWSTFLTVLLFECLQAIGISLLVFLLFPSMDTIKGLMVTNTLCLIPGILLLLKPRESKDMNKTDPNQKENLKKRFGEYSRSMFRIATIAQLIALIIWTIVSFFDNDKNNQFWCLPFALILISMSWWENFLNKTSSNLIVQKLLAVKKDLSESRYFTFSIVSVIKMIVYFVSMLLIIYLRDGDHAVEILFSKFKDGFNSDQIKLVRQIPDKEFVLADEDIWMTVGNHLIPVWILLLQICVSYVCYAFAKFTCKIHIQTFSFALPVHLAVPVTVSFIWIMVELSSQGRCKLVDFFGGFQYIFWYVEDNSAFDYYNNWENYVLSVIWFISLASQIAIEIHIWSANSPRLASTEELFINPMYNSVVIDQSLALNRRRINIREENLIEDEENTKREEKENDPNQKFYQSVDTTYVPQTVNTKDADMTTRIFVCATMWHENKEEMIQMLKAVMRLDEDQCTRKNAQLFFQLSPNFTDYYEIEFNIFFDDAFDQGETYDEDDRVINRFVRQLIETMDDAASNVHGTIVKLKKPNLVPTPYGGKLEWTLPGQNKLIAHLKDKIRIRHRKRWSQCMYMYWLLGHRIAELPIDENRKETIAMNTFILALDGDINFRPHALHLVVDLMKKNKKLGAACGRIHPIGSGPMVWYQKFEYAIGHWLQKATEHVFGCVLCSPGCFSLFRARAVMDDSVMNKYTTKPTQARHYVQYDQGEDRWLCTLLLQQGWRIEYCAASDSYTHAPEGFGEFYTQRRRWAPSTMANILDLLGEYKRTVAVNNDISRLYILYQGMLLLGTILSPGTIFLMIVGAMNTVMNLDTKISMAINIFPILIFAIICLVVKKNDHIILVAMILSTIYALLMLAVLVATAIDIKDKGILAPNSLFFVGLMSSFVVAAILHPQEFACVLPLLLYMLLIPSMYLLLTIYSVTNMHIVSWGTREVKSKLTAKEMAEQEALAKEAEAKKSQKSRFKFFDVTKYGKNSGFFTCMCCSSSRAEEEAENLIHIKSKLNQVHDTVDNLKNNMEQKGNRSSFNRRKSFVNREQNEERFNMTNQTLEEEDEDEEDSASETTSLLQDHNEHRPLSKKQTTFNLDDMSGRPKWTRDHQFKRFPYVELSDNELQFWNDFIPKYLYPLDEDRQEQERISNELLDLRNKVVFTFAILNIVFILFVYLLQMHKDVFGIRIPTGSVRNDTARYDSEEDKFVYDYIPTETEMDPIGLALIIFFGAILIIQLIGMFMHRFGTLAHLLAFTNIDFNFFGSKPKDINPKDFNEKMNRNAVNIIKKIQKQGVEEMSEKEKRSSAKDMLNRRQSVFARPQSSQPLNLNKAFMKRVMSIKANDSDVPQLQGLRRKSLGEALVNRRKTVDWGRMNSTQDSLQVIRSTSNSRNPSISSFTPRQKSIHFQEPTLHAPNQKGSVSSATRTIVSPQGSSPRIILTSIDEKPPTGQHAINYFNFLEKNIAEDMTSNIIRNSLHEATQPTPQTSGSQQTPELTTFKPSFDRKQSNGSEITQSSVSSTIEFNFDAFDVELDTSDTDFPVATLQPTSVPLHNIRDNQMTKLDDKEVSTYL